MYQVKVLEGETWNPLLIPGTDEYVLMEPELTLEMGNAGSFSFSILPVHPHFKKIHPLTSEIYVYVDGIELFRGRFAGKEEDFYRTGKIVCEGDLAYFLDSIQRPYSIEGSIDRFFEHKLESHNAQVEERKRFKKGLVNVADENNIKQRQEKGYVNTLDCLKNMLMKKHGGYLRTRVEAGNRYLDYVTDYGGINKQVIRFGENMIDLNQYTDATALATALIPLGSQTEIVNPDGSSEKKRVDITSVNGGKDYIYDEAAVKTYGYITAVREWDDVETPDLLLKKAKASLAERIALPLTMELTAIDLSLLDIEIEGLRVGCWTRVSSVRHGVEGTYLLTKKTLHLTEPEKDTILLGGKLPSLTGSNVNQNQDFELKLEETAQSASKEINAKIENATKLITGGLGGYVVIGRSKQGHPEEILIMDAPDRLQAKHVIRLNKNGLGFSTTGYNGIYRNAWTIDGNLVADFVTAGSMLADRIRGGTLEVGGLGPGKDGEILLKDAAGTILAVLDKNGIDIRKGSITGSTLVLGGAGNVNGSMTVRAADGTIICSAGMEGLYASQGAIGGWKIGTDYLETGNAIIRSYEGANTQNRATMNNASFKVWVNGSEKCYMGRGGYNGRGNSSSGLIHVAGVGGGIELDGSTGKINIAGKLEAADKITTHGGFHCEGGILDCKAKAEFKSSEGMEVSGDIMCGGNVYAGNISAMMQEINTIKRKLGM